MKILVVCTQRLGDVLLITPLIRSIKRGIKDAVVDVLVCGDTTQAMEGNPDIHRVIVVDRQSNFLQRLRELHSIWNQYELSVSTVPSDRSRIYAWAGSSKHIGTFRDRDNRIVKAMVKQGVCFDNLDTHTVSMNLKLCELLGIEKIHAVVPPSKCLELSTLFNAHQPYAVVHPYPKFTYKAWTIEAWRSLIAHLTQQGLHVYISGGAEEREVTYCQSLVVHEAVENLAGKHALSELTTIIGQAKLFIGVDTSVTHLAAATGIKVIAIYGPTNPVKWGPWPASVNSSEDVRWRSASITPQHLGNVSLIQGHQSCIPCGQEGCDKHLQSTSECLLALSAEKVINEVDRLLAQSI